MRPMQTCRALFILLHRDARPRAMKTASEVDQVRQLADEVAAKRKLVDQAEKSMEEAERQLARRRTPKPAQEVATGQEAVDFGR